MQKSEELMLLLELNGFDVTKYKLKKQLEYEKTGNIELYKHKKFADLLMSHYLFQEQKDHFHRNPLTYKQSWGEEVKSIDQFYFTHPELDREMTLKEFIQLDVFNEVQKESILYDIFDGWVEEYRESSITQMEHLKDMIYNLPKKSRKYRRPSRFPFILSVIFLLFLGFLYKSPQSIENFPIIGNVVFGGLYDQLLASSLYSFLGFILVFITAFYTVSNNFFGRFIKDVRGEKNKHVDRTFKKWEVDVERMRLKQSGLLEDYVDKVVKNNKKSFFEVEQLIGPEILINKYKNYVQMVQWKYDFLTKHYSTFMRALRWLFTLVFFLNIAFYVMGMGLKGGWF
jgi:hypothetical protein